MSATIVKHDVQGHRLVIGCDCGGSVSLPFDGVSQARCACGGTWHFDGHEIKLVTVMFSSDYRVSVGHDVRVDQERDS